MTVYGRQAYLCLKEKLHQNCSHLVIIYLDNLKTMLRSSSFRFKTTLLIPKKGNLFAAHPHNIRPQSNSQSHYLQTLSHVKAEINKRAKDCTLDKRMVGRACSFLRSFLSCICIPPLGPCFLHEDFSIQSRKLRRNIHRLGSAARP